MPEQRRKFSPQFKAQAVQMVLETGKPVAEVALIWGSMRLYDIERGDRPRIRVVR